MQPAQKENRAEFMIDFEIIQNLLEAGLSELLGLVDDRCLDGAMLCYCRRPTASAAVRLTIDFNAENGEGESSTSVRDVSGWIRSGMM